MIKKSLLRVSTAIKSVEVVDGSKFIGRIRLNGGKTICIIKGDRVVVVRRKHIVRPK